jgi:hypothetical protein
LLPRISYRDKHVMRRYKNLNNGRSEDGNISYNCSATSGFVSLRLCGEDGERVVVSYNYQLGKKKGLWCVHLSSLDGTRFSKILKIGGNVYLHVHITVMMMMMIMMMTMKR